MSKDYNVNIYWIRHAFSCGNMMGIFDKEIFMPKFVPDTPLSGLGILQAMMLSHNPEVKKILEDSHFIGCSLLTRTLQTGLYATCKIDKDIRMFPLPYINERFKKFIPGLFLKTYIQKSATPICYFRGIEKQKKLFNSILQEIKTDSKKSNRELDWRYFEKIFQKILTVEKEKIESNYDKLLLKYYLI